MAERTYFKQSLIYIVALVFVFAILEQPGSGGVITPASQTGADNQTGLTLDNGTLTTQPSEVDNTTEQLENTTAQLEADTTTRLAGTTDQLVDQTLATTIIGTKSQPTTTTQREITSDQPHGVTDPHCFRGGLMTEVGVCECPTHFTKASACREVDDDRLYACDLITREVYPEGSECDGITTCPTYKNDESVEICGAGPMATLWELKKLTPAQQDQFCEPVSDYGVLDIVLLFGNYTTLFDTSAGLAVPGNETHPCLYYYPDGQLVADYACPRRPTLCYTGTSVLDD